MGAASHGSQEYSAAIGDDENEMHKDHVDFYREFPESLRIAKEKFHEPMKRRKETGDWLQSAIKMNLQQ